MSDKTEFPIFEINLLIVTNTCSTIMALICCFHCNPELSFISLLKIIKYFVLANIFLPLLAYFFLYYISCNKNFLEFSLAINRNLINKIKMCLLLFIFSPTTFLCILLPFIMVSLAKQLILHLNAMCILLSMATPFMLFFIFEPIITKLVNKHCEKYPNSKSWLKKNYDLRMEIQKEL